MSVHPTTKHPTYAPARILAIAGTCIAATLAFTGVAAATTTTDQPGNPRCAAGMTEVKIEPVQQGFTAFAGGSITVSDRTFSWSTDQGVDAVIVKGGPNATINTLDEARSGEGYRAPINPSSGQPYGLSHISFCFDADQPKQEQPCPEGTVKMADGTCKADEPKQEQPCPEGTVKMADGTCKADEPKQEQPCPEGTVKMADGTCKADEPKQPGPCEAGGPMTKADGSPCAQTSSEPPVTTTTFETPASAPTPVSVTVASRTEPGQTQVLGATGMVRQRPTANAKMQGPKRCVTRPFRQSLRGQGIKRVTILVNGKKVRTFTGARSTYAISIDPRKYRSGVLRVSARIEYVAASGKKAQTLRLTVLRCADRAGQQVRFAG
jgi:hypothetical protein